MKVEALLEFLEKGTGEVTESVIEGAGKVFSGSFLKRPLGAETSGLSRGFLNKKVDLHFPKTPPHPDRKLGG